MKRKLRHPVLIYTLLLLLAAFPVFDFALWRVDPAGVVRFFHDIEELQAHAVPAPEGLRYTPGVIEMNMYTVTIGAEGFRAVPESRGGACRIVFVGDSMTFGEGSDLSYVNLLAPDIPATVINAANNGYNVENIRDTLNAVPADGYVWLVFLNDDQPPVTWRAAAQLPPALIIYREYLLPSFGWTTPNPDYFKRYAAPILARDDVLPVAFAGLPLTDIAAALRPDLVTIPMYSGQVSVYDGHPPTSGHQQMADSMRTRVVEFTKQRCA